MKPTRSTFDIRHWSFDILKSHVSYLTSCVFLLTSYFVLGCKPLQSTITETIIRDSVIIKEVPKIIEVPGSTITTQSINVDSLAKLLKSGVDPRIIERHFLREDPETGLRVGILIDRLGNLTALCEQQDRTIQTLEREITHLRSEISNKETTITNPVSFWKRVRNAIIYMVIGALILPIIRLAITIFGPLPRLPNPFK